MIFQAFLDLRVEPAILKNKHRLRTINIKVTIYLLDSQRQDGLPVENKGKGAKVSSSRKREGGNSWPVKHGKMNELKDVL